MHAEMLGVRIRAHVEATSDLFGLNVGVGFHNKQCMQLQVTQIRTCVTHGDNGKKIGPLK